MCLFRFIELNLQIFHQIKFKTASTEDSGQWSKYITYIHFVYIKDFAILSNLNFLLPFKEKFKVNHWNKGVREWNVIILFHFHKFDNQISLKCSHSLCNPNFVEFKFVFMNLIYQKQRKMTTKYNNMLMLFQIPMHFI